MVESGTCYHLTGDTPSDSPRGLPAPPPGSRVQPPLKGLAAVAVFDGVQLLHAKLRTAHRAGGVSRGTQNTIWNAPRGMVRIRPGFYKAMGAYRETPQSGPKGLPAPLSGALFLLPPLGVVLRAANQDSNDCRWQSLLCFVPRKRQRGWHWYF